MVCGGNIVAAHLIDLWCVIIWHRSNFWNSVSLPVIPLAMFYVMEMQVSSVITGKLRKVLSGHCQSKIAPPEPQSGTVRVFQTLCWLV
jgi:hypothetical protein